MRLICHFFRADGNRFSAMLILADPSASASTGATNIATRGSEAGELTIAVPGYAVSGAKTVQVEIKD